MMKSLELISRLTLQNLEIRLLAWEDTSLRGRPVLDGERPLSE
jgi:hypothetical protein